MKLPCIDTKQYYLAEDVKLLRSAWDARKKPAGWSRTDAEELLGSGTRVDFLDAVAGYNTYELPKEKVV